MSLKELDDLAFDCIYEMCPDQQWFDYDADVESSDLVALDEAAISVPDFLSE